MSRPVLSYANVASTLALVVALSGVSYAAVTIPKNSVGSPQVINGSLAGADIMNDSLTGKDIKESTLSTPANALHLQGKTWVEVRFGSDVPAGTTIRGSWGYDSEAAAGGGDYRAYVPYGAEFAAALTPEYAVAGPSTHCPGTAADPQADPGYICSYLLGSGNVNVGSLNGAYLNTRWAFVMNLSPIASGDFYANGTWAATAP